MKKLFLFLLLTSGITTANPQASDNQQHLTPIIRGLKKDTMRSTGISDTPRLRPLNAKASSNVARIIDQYKTQAAEPKSTMEMIWDAITGSTRNIIMLSILGVMILGWILKKIF